MQTSNYSEAFDELVYQLCKTGTDRMRILESQHTGFYYVGEPEMPGEAEWVMENKNCRTIMDLNFMETKVLIARVKQIRKGLGLDGDSKENNEGRKQSGSDNPGSHTGESESSQGRSDSDGELPGPDGDDSTNDSGVKTGNGTRAHNAAGTVGELIQKNDVDSQEDIEP